MGFMDDLKKLAKPYAEDDDDFDEFDDDVRPSRANRGSTAPAPKASLDDLGLDDSSSSASFGSGRRVPGGNKVVNIHTTAQMQVVLVKPEKFEDASAIAETLREREKQRRAELLAQQKKEERDALVAKITSGELDIWSMFDSYVILGDSRAVGFYYFDFLEKSRVLADGGNTIRDVAAHMDDIRALQPDYVYLCYGLNDISIGYWDTKEEYVAELLQVVADLKEALPGVTVPNEWN